MPGRSLLPPPGAGRSSHPARAGQPGSASAQRCRPAAARSYGPPPGRQHRPAARHRCPSRSAPRQGAPASPALAVEGRSSGPRCQIRSSCGLHHAPRPAAARFAPPLRPLPPAAGLCGSGALHPAARQKGTGRALGAGCGPPQYPPGVNRCSPPCRAVRPRICPPQRAAGLARARCCPRTGPPPGQLLPLREAGRRACSLHLMRGRWPLLRSPVGPAGRVAAATWAAAVQRPAPGPVAAAQPGHDAAPPSRIWPRRSSGP